MKKFLAVVLVALVVIGGYMMLKPKYYTEEKYVNQEVGISYDSVNVRNNPNGKKIGELERNTKVTLTGEVCKQKSGGPAELDNWVEIQFKDGTAWITEDAIK